MAERLEMKKDGKKRWLVYCGLFFFIYSFVTSVAIQTILIPKVFPSFDLGEGLIVLDSHGFNQIAKQKADAIKTKGWEAWELRPGGQSPAGIASIFYACWVPKPYSMLPFNALVHALCGCLVCWLLFHFFSRQAAMLGGTLFIMNPAAMEWVAQMHRDGVFILGNLLVLVCLVLFLEGMERASAKALLGGLFLGVAGTGVVWVARPYWLAILLVSVLLGVLLIGVSWRRVRNMSQQEGVARFWVVPCVLGLLLFQGWVTKNYGHDFVAVPPADEIKKVASLVREAPKVRPSPGEATTVRPPLGEGTQVSPSPGEVPKVVSQPVAAVEVVPQQPSGTETNAWGRTPWLPEFFEIKLYQISVVRLGVILTGGNTVVDADVVLNSADAFMSYLPRALQVGLLSPLPDLWQGTGSTPAMTLARRIMGVVTVIFYCCLLGTLTSLFSHRKDPVAWIMVTYCLLGIVVFTYSYPNIGTLLRFRYGFYMVFISFGAAAIMEKVRAYLGSYPKIRPFMGD